MDKRYQIFISSTFEDLKDERQSVIKAVLELDHMPAGMELFPASDDTAWRLICDVIDASDYYVLIVGGRYGSLDETGISYTEKEHDYAVSNKKPVIALLNSNPDNLPRGRTETDTAAWEKLQSFRKKVEKNHTCNYWDTPGDLKSQVIVGLTSAIKRYPSEGWIRAGVIASEEATREIIRLQKIVASQKVELERLGSTPPVGSEKFAQEEDSIKFVAKFTLTNKDSDFRDSDRTIREDCEMKLTWNKLFISFAPILINPTPETKMKSAITMLIREDMKAYLEAKHLGYNVTHSLIRESFFQKMKIQFLALGLIDAKLKTTVSIGSEKDIPVCELTNLGKRKLIKLNAIIRE